MKPITKEEIQTILDSGVTKNFIEKKLGMGQGSIGKFLTSKLNSLPDKYAAGIRKIGKSRLEDLELGKHLVEEGIKSLENLPKDLKAPENLDMRPISNELLKEVPEGTIQEIKYSDRLLSEFEKGFFCDPNAFKHGKMLMGVPDKCHVEYVNKEEEVTIKRPKINKDLLP